MKYLNELKENDLKEWLLSPLVDDDSPDVLLSNPEFFVNLYRSEPAWVKKGALFMGLPLSIQQRYISQHIFSLEDCIKLFTNVDIPLDHLVSIMEGLDLDKQLSILQQFRSSGVSLINNLVIALCHDQEYPELFSTSQSEFRTKLIKKVSAWVADYDQSLTSIRPFLSLSIIDSDEPCIVFDRVCGLFFKKLDSTKAIRSKKHLMALIKLSYLLSYHSEITTKYQSFYLQLHTQFYNTFVTLETSQLVTICHQLPLDSLLELVRITLQNQESEDFMKREAADRFYQQLQSISQSQCDKLKLVTDLFFSNKDRE